MAQFRPGQSGNPAGRPRGARGKTVEQIRAIILKIIGENAEKIRDDLESLDPKDRLTILDRLMKHALPAPIDDILRLSDADFEKLVHQVKKDLQTAIY